MRAVYTMAVLAGSLRRDASHAAAQSCDRALEVGVHGGGLTDPF